MAQRKYKWLKITGGLIVAVLLIIIVLIFILSKPLPSGEEGPEADQLARRMQEAIHYPEWEKTGAVQWTFAQSHHLVWDRKRHFAQVSWGEYRVLVNLHNKTGIAYKNEEKVSEKENQNLVTKAWGFWANDSFWLNAPAKAFDEGTSRKLVKTEEGKKALLVSYSSGGVTPGDAYLWEFDEQGLPSKYSMWVSIIPIKGIEVTWSGWKTTESGAKIATKHDTRIFTLMIENVRTADRLTELTEGKDIFKPL